MKQTAVEFYDKSVMVLIAQYDAMLIDRVEFVYQIEQLNKQAKEMEKKQCGRSFNSGYNRCEWDNSVGSCYDEEPKEFEQYYNETYGSKGSDAKCPNCGAMEVDAMSPRTIYECGSSDYDQRPNTFKQSEGCKGK